MAPFIGDGCSSSNPGQIRVGGLYEWNEKTKAFREFTILPRKPLVIGRSPKTSQITVDDPQVSKKHLRVYSIIFDPENPEEVVPLVYAQDISSNGSLWNGRRLDKRTGSVLLSDNDTLKVCDHVTFTFKGPKHEANFLSNVQKEETKALQSEYLITNRVLGSGAYGQVQLAIDQRSGAQLACKIVDLTVIRSHLQLLADPISRQSQNPIPGAEVDPHAQIVEVQKRTERQEETRKLESRLRVYNREVEILQKLRHPNIIGIEKVFKTENTLYIFQDLIPAGDLLSYLEFKGGKLYDTEAAVIVRQIVIAVDYLHCNNIVHRDLKPDNVLMTSLMSGCRVVLTDFGCARYVPQKTNRMTSIMGTFEYTAPEIDRATIKSRNGYTKSVDMWSIGCVTAVLLTGGSPFQHPDTLSYSRELAQECNIAKLEAAEEWIDVGHRARDFVRRLLTLDESQRMTAKEALLHDWFTNPFHERIFEQIYQHSIADWKPKSGKIDQIWDSHSLTGPEPNGQVYQCQSAGNRTSSTNASLQINHTVPSHKAGDGAHTGHMASAIVVDAKTHGFESLTIQGSKLPLLSGPVTARPQMRLPFSQAAWNEVIDSPKPLKVQHSMGPPSNAYPCRPMQTGGGQFQSIVKLSRPMSKVLQGIKQGGNKRCADI